jgi:hypothetical protein
VFCRQAQHVSPGAPKKLGGARPQILSGPTARSFCVWACPRRVACCAEAVPVKSPNVHPRCVNVPHIGDDGFEELCHLVTEEDPDTALCGKDVTGYPWNPPWPRCEACLAVARGEMN